MIHGQCLHVRCCGGLPRLRGENPACQALQDHDVRTWAAYGINPSSRQIGQQLVAHEQHLDADKVGAGEGASAGSVHEIDVQPCASASHVNVNPTHVPAAKDETPRCCAPGSPARGHRRAQRRGSVAWRRPGSTCSARSRCGSPPPPPAPPGTAPPGSPPTPRRRAPCSTLE